MFVPVTYDSNLLEKLQQKNSFQFPKMLNIFLLYFGALGFISKTNGNSCTMPLSKVDPSGTCYWIIGTQQNFTQSHKKCLDSGGFIALIPDPSNLQTVNDLLSAEGFTSEVYIGYSVDTVNNYRLTTLAGLEQTWSQFYSSSTLSNEWSCVSVYLSNFWPEKCDNNYYALCSDLQNTGITSSSSSILISSSFSEISTMLMMHSSTPIIYPSTEAGSTSVPCDCSAHCSTAIQYTQALTNNMTDDLNSKIEQMVSELKVEKNTLSSSVRKRTSASDPRPTAVSLGCVGIVIMVLVAGGILLLDLPLIVKASKGFFNQARNLCK